MYAKKWRSRSKRLDERKGRRDEREGAKEGGEGREMQTILIHSIEEIIQSRFDFMQKIVHRAQRLDNAVERS